MCISNQTNHNTKHLLHHAMTPNYILHINTISCLKSIIQQEIDLLKNLNHTNIVKYVRYIRTKSDLYIVLEYVLVGRAGTILLNYI